MTLFPFIKRTPRSRFFFFLINDIILITCAIYASFYIRYDFTIPYQYAPNIPWYVIVTIGVLVPIFYFRKLYHFTWVYVSVDTLINLFISISYTFFFLGFAVFIAKDTQLAQKLPRATILISFVLIFIFTSAIRFSKRIYTELFVKKHELSSQKPRVLLIGATDNAEHLLRDFKKTPNLYPFEIVGILDDTDLKQNTAIHSVSVLGRLDDLHKIKQSQNIFGVIIAYTDISPQRLKRIFSVAQQAGITSIKTLPALPQFLGRYLSIKDIRDIKVEDLLGRKKIDINFKEVSELIWNKTICITGAAGSIGGELSRQIRILNPKRLICIDIDETRLFELHKELTENNPSFSTRAYICSILNKEKIYAIIAHEKPDIIFHAAAYKHVTMMEKDIDEAVRTNILGTWNMAEAALRSHVGKFVLISTDKAVNPTSVMGMTKRVAEKLIFYYNTKTQFIAVRFGNVLGSRGSVVEIFKKQILSGGPVTVTHPEMKRYFMVPSEAILLVLQAASIGRGGEILILDMGKPVKILELARTMIELAGLTPDTDIPIVFTHPFQGEKIHEKIFTEKETMHATKNNDIFMVPQEAKIDKDIFFSSLNKLIDSAQKPNSLEDIRLLLEDISI